MQNFFVKTNYNKYRVTTRFLKFFQVFQISSRFLKVHIFGSIFRLKVSLNLKTVLNSIKPLKRYCKATLNSFFN